MSSKMSAETKHNITHTGMLLLAAFVWGMAFPFQRIGAGYVEGWTFLTFRSWLSVLVMLPVVMWRNRRKAALSATTETAAGGSDTQTGAANGQTKTSEAAPKDRLKGWGPGILCGIFLCLASGLQQVGIADTSTAKSGFITAMYVIIVPVLSWIFLKRRQPRVIWLSIALCVTGLYLLCFPGGSGGFTTGDLLTLACAFLFAIQIMLVDRYVGRIGALNLTFQQFVVEAILSTVLMFLFEHPTVTGLQKAWIAIAYAGIMSSAVGYSLQAAGQKNLNPAVASLAMCMESVFSAIGGWILLGESLSPIEALGCVLMFAAIVLTEIV